MSKSANGERRKLRIKRHFKGVGLIRRSLGTDNRTVFKQRVALLEKLEKLERYELLRAFNEDRVTIEELVEADANERLGTTLADMALKAKLFGETGAIVKALPRMGKAETTRNGYEGMFRQLERKGAKYLGPHSTVEDLKSVPWQALYEEWGTSNTDWQHLFQAISRFLSVTLDDKYHPFARKFRSDFPKVAFDKREPNVSITAFRKIVGAAAAHARRAYWCLVVTGLRVEEYLSLDESCLDHEAMGLILKEAGADKGTGASKKMLLFDPEVWSLVVEGVPSPLRYQWLNRYWNRAVTAAGFEDIHLHDLRHCAGQWATDGGASRMDVVGFLRHESSAQTDDYLRRKGTRAASKAIGSVIFAKPELVRSA